jgi:hypothetical protein
MPATNQLPKCRKCSFRGGPAKLHKHYQKNPTHATMKSIVHPHTNPAGRAQAKAALKRGGKGVARMRGRGKGPFKGSAEKRARDRAYKAHKRQLKLGLPVETEGNPGRKPQRPTHRSRWNYCPHCGGELT